MSKNLIRIVILLSVIAAAGWLEVPVRADEGNPVDFTPENTVILSNQTDYDFCMDFSVLLKNLTVEWIILDSAEIPESTKDKHLILVGGLDSKYTSEIISEMLTTDEMNLIQQRGFLVIEEANPWAEDHVIYISAGMDNLLTKRAAEEAVQRMLTTVNRRGDWLFPVANITRDEVMEYISPLQYLAEGDELSQDALRVDFDAKSPRKITLDEAAEDVERFFYLLSHGYCGYGYFQTEGDFEAAKANILGALESQSNWTPNDLAATISSELNFIHDCHLNLGRQKFCGHLDFWYDASLELWKYQGAYYFNQDAIEFRVLSVNGNPPENFVFPSLNEGGDPIYRLGVLYEDDRVSIILII